MAVNQSIFTHFIDGVNSVESSSPFAALDVGNPAKYAVFYEDFLNFDFGDYPTDSDAVALQYAVTLDTELDYDVSFGGSTGDLILTTEGGDTEGGQFRLNASPFKLTAAKKAWFEARLNITATTVAQYSFFVGLSTNTTGTNFIDDAGTALAVDNAWGFVSYDASAEINPVVRVSDVSSTETGTHTMVTATYAKYQLYYDGSDTHFYVDGVKKGVIEGTHPTAAMTMMVHFKSQSVEAGVLNLDHVLVIVEK